MVAFPKLMENAVWFRPRAITVLGDLLHPTDNLLWSRSEPAWLLLPPPTSSIERVILSEPPSRLFQPLQKMMDADLTQRHNSNGLEGQASSILELLVPDHAFTVLH